MTRVLITLSRLERGGAEMRLLQFLTETRARNADIVPFVFLTSGIQGSLDDAYRAVGAHLIYGAPGIKGLWHLYRICRKERPDIVHANALLASGFYLFVAYLAGVRTRIAHIRSTSYDRNDWLFRRRNDIFRAFLNTFSTQIVGVCDAARTFAGASPSQWQTVYNGLAPEPGKNSEPTPSALSKKKLQIVFLGRLHPAKNPVRTLDIMLAVKTLIEGRATLKIHGRLIEPLNSVLATRLRELGLEEHVELCGETDAPLSALKAADVLLLTSLREGLPGVVLEALSCGTPVVASALPGVLEIARHCRGVTAVQLTEDNHVWAEALIAASRSDREAIAADFRSSPFTFDNHYRQMLALWKPTSKALRKIEMK